jgi:hypothetical protein
LLYREFDQRVAIGVVFIKDNVSPSLISILANGCDVKECEIVFIGYEKDTILLLFKPNLNLHVWGPELRVVRPSTRPFFQAVGVSDLDQTYLLRSKVIFISRD